LLAQQLLAAGEQVVDVQPKLGARVRLLADGAVNKNDPNDARSFAVAALRSPARRRVEPDDHAAVLKMWAKRHRDLGRARTQVVCRLHAVLCELIAGGVSKRISAPQAGRLLEGIRPAGAAEAARYELAAELLEDLRRIDEAAPNRRGAGIHNDGHLRARRDARIGDLYGATLVGDGYRGRPPSRWSTADVPHGHANNRMTIRASDARYSATC
jgi:hypothetical protein